jgi:hypothetical protein
MGTSVTADAPKLPPVTGEPPHAHGDTANERLAAEADVRLPFAWSPPTW